MSRGERCRHFFHRSCPRFQSSNKSSKSSSPQSSFPALSAAKRVAPSPADGLDTAPLALVFGLLEAAEVEKPKSSKKSSVLTVCFFTTGAAGRPCLGGDAVVGGGRAASCLACSGFFKPPDRFTAKPLLRGGALLLVVLSNEPAARSVAELGDLLRR